MKEKIGNKIKHNNKPQISLVNENCLFCIVFSPFFKILKYGFDTNRAAIMSINSNIVRAARVEFFS